MKLDAPEWVPTKLGGRKEEMGFCLGGRGWHMGHRWKEAASKKMYRLLSENSGMASISVTDSPNYERCIK